MNDLHEIKNKKRTLAYLNKYLVLLAVIVFSPVVGAQSKSELKVIVEHLPNDFDYSNSRLSWSSFALINLAEGLLSINAAGEQVLGQAESWSVSDDGLQYQFKLRENANWSDGRPVVAEDFVLAWQRMVDPARKNSNEQLLSLIKNYAAVRSGSLAPEQLGVRAIGKKQLEITLSSASNSFLRLLVSFKLSPIPSHYDSEELFSEPERMVVNGAYAVETRTDGRVVLSKNPHYWDAENVYYESIYLSENESKETTLTSVLSNEVDIANVRWQNEFDWAKNRYPSYFKEFPVLHTDFYMFNVDKNKPTIHADVREALSMVIDREKIARHIFKGTAYPAYSLAPPVLYSLHQPRAPSWLSMEYPERLKEARTILKKRGVGPASPISIELKTQKYSNRYKVALAVKQDWERVGVNLDIVTDSAKNTYDQIGKGDFQVARGGFLLQGYDLLAVFKELKISNVDYPGIPKSKKVDELIARAETSNSTVEQEAILAEVEEINHKQVQIMQLYHLRGYLLRSPEIRGIGEAPFTTALRWVRPVAFGE